ncbi:unnamed protein product, partial [Staurois parvus]
MLSLGCIARDFFSWESACDQHRVIKHCPDRGHGSCFFLEQNKNSSYKLSSFRRRHKMALTTDEKRYLTVYMLQNNCISMFCVLWEARYNECRIL